MDKKIYLTKAEQEVYDLLRKKQGDIITSGELYELYPSLPRIRINKVASGLARKGYLYRIRRGTYIVQGEPSSRPLVSDPFAIATIIHPGYLAFSTALRIYELIEYEPATIYVATTNVSEEIPLGEYTLKYVALGRRATGETHLKGYYISTKTKTFYDCLHKPQYVGYGSLTKALYLNDGCRWRELLGYFDEYASDSLCQRTGYVLALLNEKTDIDMPAYVIKYFKERVKTRVRLNPRDSRAGTYRKEWMIMDNVGEGNIISWF